MTEPSESVLRRIRALLERAEHANTGEHEREAAMAKAADLMAAYGVQRTMLSATQGVDDPIDATVIAMTDPYSYEKAMLLIYIAIALHCKTHRWWRGRKTTRVAIIGAASDRERIEMLYTSLLIQAQRGMFRESSPYPDAAATKGLRAAFLVGFGMRIGERLTEAEARAAQTYDEQRPAGSVGTELVLVDRAALVEQRYAELFPNATKGRVRSYNASAWNRGDAAGRAADIGAAKVNGGRTRQLGAAR